MGIDSSLNLKFRRIIKVQTNFFGSEIYHDRFSIGYNGTHVSDLANFFWPDAGRLPATSLKFQRLLLLCTIPMEEILWNQVTRMIEKKR